MSYRSRLSLRLTILAACALTFVGCDSIRDAAGLGKQGPDEFAVVTKQPLVIPPEFNLRPPRDGAPPTNQIAPTDAAQSALFEGDVTTKNVTGDFSQAEKLLLVQAGAVNTDPAIRQEIASDGKAMQAADDDFTNQVLFWQASGPDKGTNVDAEAEAKRIAAQKTGGDATTERKPPDDSATIDNKEESKGGWLDGIF